MQYILGFLFGIPASMIAAILMGPALETLSGYRTIRFIAGFDLVRRSERVFRGDWRQTWEVLDGHQVVRNESALRIYRLWRIVAFDFHYTARNGELIEGRGIGTLEERLLTGRWMDAVSQGYHGAFQLYLSPNREVAEGVWVGYSTRGIIKSGAWQWVKSPRQSV